LEYEEAKEKIVAALTKKLKTKSKFYFNDLAKILDMKPAWPRNSSTSWFRRVFWNIGHQAAPPCTACPAPANRPAPSTKTNSGPRRQAIPLVNRRFTHAFETGSIQPAAPSVTPGIVVAALRGGSGKTIFSVGIIAALKGLGRSVAPFKKGAGLH
jgi:hypothetical protein